MSDEEYGIDLAVLPIDLQPPRDEPVRAPAAANRNGWTSAHPNSPWVFRSCRRGMHVTSTHVRNHLRPILATRSTPRQTERTDPNEPIAILAETLGYSPQTLEARGRASASTYARCVATRLD